MLNKIIVDLFANDVIVLNKATSIYTSFVKAYNTPVLFTSLHIGDVFLLLTAGTLAQPLGEKIGNLINKHYNQGV